jgi:hypothetical protein
MSRARYWRHDSTDIRGFRMTVDHAFFGQSVLWNSRRKRPLTKAEQHAIAHQILIGMGFMYYQRCTRGWRGVDLDAEAQQLGVVVVRSGEAALEACPRCGLYEQLLGLLVSRLTARLTMDHIST